MARRRTATIPAAWKRSTPADQLRQLAALSPADYQAFVVLLTFVLERAWRDHFDSPRR